MCTNGLTWDKLLDEKRHSGECTYKSDFEEDKRYKINAFQSDYDKIITSYPFRKLQDKTQVFPLDNHDFVRTRLTHSLEVSSLSQKIWLGIFFYLKNHTFQYEISNVNIKEIIPKEEQSIKILSLLQTAALIHDIGNPPFGHYGEMVIQNFFKNNQNTIYQSNTLEELQKFDGNAQGIRIVSKLINFFEPTYALLSVILKYPNRQDKLSYFESEKHIIESIYSTLFTGVDISSFKPKHPLTYILEASDDIAYLMADIEDAYKKKILNIYSIHKTLKCHAEDNQYSDREKEYLMTAIEKLKTIYESGIYNEESIEIIQDWTLWVKNWLIQSCQFIFTGQYLKIMGYENFYQNDDTLSLLNWKENLNQFNNKGHALYKALQDIAQSYIYCDEEILKKELAADEILSFLLQQFHSAVQNKCHNQKSTKKEDKLYKLIPYHFKELCQCSITKSEGDETKIYHHHVLMITDYISSMTDHSAKILYQNLKGIL